MTVTLFIIDLVFLLVIVLGVQVQITQINRELADLRKKTDKLSRELDER